MQNYRNAMILNPHLTLEAFQQYAGIQQVSRGWYDH